MKHRIPTLKRITSTFSRKLNSTIKRDSTCLFCSACLQSSESTANAICKQCYSSLPLLDKSCKSCGINIAAEDSICGDCLKCKPIWTKCLAAFRYEKPINSLVVKLKFHNKDAYSKTIAKAMLHEFSKKNLLNINSTDVLTPIPMHKKRFRERGFNQSKLIADSLSSLTGLKTLDCLRRVNHTKPQASLAKRARETSQMQFSINESTAFDSLKNQPDSKIILIDDVMTTGATIKNASKQLKKMGILNIEVWVFARTC